MASTKKVARTRCSNGNAKGPLHALISTRAGTFVTRITGMPHEKTR